MLRIHVLGLARRLAEQGAVEGVQGAHGPRRADALSVPEGAPKVLPCLGAGDPARRPDDGNGAIRIIVPVLRSLAGRQGADHFQGPRGQS